MKETTKKYSLELPREVLKASGLANGQELGALSLDGVVLLTRDSMPIVELLQMLDTLHRYAAAMLTQIAVECGPCEKRTNRSQRMMCWRNARSRSHPGCVSRQGFPKTRNSLAMCAMV